MPDETSPDHLTAGPRVFFQTFGCQMNTADSEEMARALRRRGFSATDELDRADWVLVNTCTVRQHAEDKAMSYVGRLKAWKRDRPGRRVVVAGCAAERTGESLRARFPHVDLVAGAKSMDRFSALLDDFLDGGYDGPREMADPWGDGAAYPAHLLKRELVANVTIMRGCNYACTYCIVPDVRGREVYRPAASVLAEVREKAAAGVREVMLLGQTVNSYRPAPASDGIADFADLLRAVDRVPGVERIRFMSPHPFYLNERLARALAESPNVCPHIHLPVQSGSNAVLKRMRRNYTREDYLRRVEALRRVAPGIDVTTDVIVGFPGETEEDFQATLSLLREADVAAAYCFKYSPRPGTDAAETPDDISREVKEERLARLLEALDAQTTRHAARLVGTQQSVRVDSVEAEGAEVVYSGQTRSFWKIRFTSPRPLSPGGVADVSLGRVEGRSLLGQAVA